MTSFHEKQFIFYDFYDLQQHLAFIASSWNFSVNDSGLLWAKGRKLNPKWPVDDDAVEMRKGFVRTQLSSSFSRRMWNAQHVTLKLTRIVASSPSQGVYDASSSFFPGGSLLKLGISRASDFMMDAEHMKNHKIQWSVMRFASDPSGCFRRFVNDKTAFSLLRPVIHYLQAQNSILGEQIVLCWPGKQFISPIHTYFVNFPLLKLMLAQGRLFIVDSSDYCTYLDCFYADPR